MAYKNVAPGMHRARQNLAYFRVLTVQRKWQQAGPCSHFRLHCRTSAFGRSSRSMIANRLGRSQQGCGRYRLLARLPRSTSLNFDLKPRLV